MHVKAGIADDAVVRFQDIGRTGTHHTATTYAQFTGFHSRIQSNLHLVLCAPFAGGLKKVGVSYAQKSPAGTMEQRICAMLPRRTKSG